MTNKVTITKLKTNYKVEYDFRRNLSDFIKEFPEEHRQIKTEYTQDEYGNSYEKWYRLVSEYYIGKVIGFLKDNNVPFGFTNLTQEEVEELKRQFNERQDRLVKSLSIKAENINTDNVDFSYMKLQPYEYQKQASVFFDMCGGKAILGDSPGVGKSLKISTLASTDKGWVKMGDLKIGDKVLHHDGNFYPITGVYPQGQQENYKFILNDDFETDCNMEHLWMVRDFNRRRRGTGWAVKTLRELVDMGLSYNNPSGKRAETNRKLALKWEIPMVQPANYLTQEYVIEPYLLGALIGDGSFVGDSSISISIPDFKIPIKDRIKSLIPELIKIKKKKITNEKECPTYLISKTSGNENIFKTELKKLKINVKSPYRFIPEKYLIGDKEQRLELLRGLMDTDGSALKNRIHYHTSSKRLAYDVAQLVQSLGGQAIIKEYIREKEGKSTEWRVNVRMNVCPFHLDAKKEEWWVAQKNGAVRYIKDVFYTGMEEHVCISVDSPDNTFVVENYIVTHNTASAMTYAAGKKQKTLIVCPSNLRLNWRKEIELFTHEKAFVYKWKPTKKSGKINHSKEDSLFHIISYDSLGSYVEIATSHTCKNVFCGWKEKNSKRRYKDKICPKCGIRAMVTSRATKDFAFVEDKEGYKLNPEDYQILIMDEAHYIKNGEADRTKIIKKTLKDIPSRILLTGTAIKSRPYEFFSLLNFVNPEEWKNSHSFGVKYCAAEKSNFGWNYNGASNLDELFEKISPFFLRRLKKDILKFLPPKTYTIIPIELNDVEAREYKKIEQGIIEEGQEDDNKLNHLTRIQKLKQFTSEIKMKKAFEFIQDIVDSGEKVVVFSQYKDVSYKVLERFKDKCVIFNGDRSSNQKDEAVEAFMNDDKVQVFSGTIGAAGVGITLTVASISIFIDQPWTPADREQCEDRIHRASSTAENIQIIRLVCQDTIDETIETLLNQKASILSKILDGTEFEQEVSIKDGSIFLELVQSLYGK